VGEIETVVAPVTVHCNVEYCPEAMLLGLAVKPVTTGRFDDPTATVAVAVTEPELLVAVRV
jgi:hypothetical protein